ncbi:MAG: cell envelope integrity protein CreD [Methanosarcina sp.]
MKLEINESGKWQNSFSVKLILLAIMSLFLLIPLEMIKSIIQERQTNSDAIKKEISFQWAGAQTISGPVLNVPVIIYPVKNNSEPSRIVYHFMPEKLDINGSASTEKRHKSIYEAVVYTTDISIQSEFIIPEINISEKKEILWNEAYYTMGISYNRGIKGSITMKTDSSIVEAEPGLKDNDLFTTGITIPAKVDAATKYLTCSTSLKISGSESIRFSPMGKNTTVNLQSNWSSPGFAGNFLPLKREITDSGFVATWLVTNLNRNFPQSWSGNSFQPESDSFGVDFVLQVDHYQKSLRSAKYGILFISLTFLALLFAEFTTDERINVFHYLLLAFSLVLFFSMLNALSEQVGFNMAYLISSISTIGLITTFLKALLRQNKIVLLISGLLVFLYTFIFILLSLNDYAYLAGNIGLFILLAITMRISLRLKILNNRV